MASSSLLDMLFGNVIQHAKAHLLRFGDRKARDRRAVEQGREPLLRIKPEILARRLSRLFQIFRDTSLRSLR